MTPSDHELFRTLVAGRRQSFLEWLGAALPEERANGSFDRMVHHLEQALDRIEKGNPGACELCHGSLERELVVACPEAEICLDCMQDRERRQLEEDLRLAQEVSRSLLPRLVPEASLWDVGIHYRSSRILSGDFYEVGTRPEPETLSLAVGDVAGKGIPAGLLRTSLQATLRALGYRGLAPADLMQETNRHFHATSHPGRFASVFYGVLANANGRGLLVYANGGHLPPLLRRRSGQWESLKPTGTVLGLLDGARYQEASCTIEAGDVLVLYTDGITEAQDFSGNFFDEPMLVQAVDEAVGLSAQEMADRVAAEVSRFSPGPPSDDRTLVVLRRWNRNEHH